jgi:RNA polymerase sigma-70 factor (sigma-E family)
MARRDDEFEAFFEAEFPHLFRLAYLLTGNPADAEEMAQEAMVRTYRAWGRIREDQPPFAYARTTLINHRRSLARRSRVAEQHDSTQREPVLELNAERVAVWEALLGLPKTQRDAIVLRYYEGLTETEAAAVMRCPVGTVKSHLKRGLARLRVGLRDESSAAEEPKESV